MPERVNSNADEDQTKRERLRRLYALHDPMASEEQINVWINESVDSADHHNNSYDDQIERVERQIIHETQATHSSDIHRIEKNVGLFSNIADLSSELTIDKVGRVRYAIGAIAVDSTGEVRGVGGRFVPQAWLEAIDAHSEQIRSELAYRHESVAQREDRIGQMEENKPFKIIDKRRAPLEHVPEHDSEVIAEKNDQVLEENNDNEESSASVEYEPLTLTFIDQTHDALVAARDAAEARRRNELQYGGRFSRFLKNIWKGENGIAGAYYLEKYKKEALSKIQHTNDIYSHESQDEQLNISAQLATIERFQSDFDESIHEDAGERRMELDDSSEFAISAKELIARYVSGDIESVEALTEERDRLVATFNRSELVGEGKVRIDNIVAIANQVKAIADHGVSVETVLAGMKIYSAESRSNVRSEVHLSKIEHTVDRLQQTKIGGLVRPETIGAAAAIGLGIARAGRGTLLRAAGVTLVPGVLGGAFAALREGKRVKEERSLHSREMAQGKEYANGTRRNEMEKARYETMSALDVKNKLDSVLNSDVEQSMTAQQVQEAYEFIAGIEARIQLSDRKNIDLVAYSNVTAIERERQQLDESRALAKIRLSKHIGDLPLDFKQRFAIEDDHTVNAALQQYTEATVDIARDISTKDDAFRKLRRRRMLKAGVTGAATSLVIGLGAQEAIAAANTNYDGLIEHAIKGSEPSQNGSQTVLEGLVHGEQSIETVERAAPSAAYHSYELGTNGAVIDSPEGYEVIAHEDGKLSITTPMDGETIRDLEVDENGFLTNKSLAILEQHSVAVSDTGGFVEHTGTSVKTLNAAEYVKLHANEMTHVKRDFWYDNNTVKQDGNELQLQWKDANESANNSTTLRLSGMDSGGSVSGDQRVNWSHDAKNGKLKLAVSLSRDTQSQVFMVDVKPNGDIDIPHDSPAAQFFNSSKPEFTGAYAEVVQIRGEADDVTHVAPLATLVGDGSTREFSQTVTSTTQEYVPKYKITPPPTEIMAQASGREVEGFGAPVLTGRKPLERLYVSRRKSGSGYEGYGGAETALKKFNMSPRLAVDPTAELKLGDELRWFADDLETREGAEYVANIRDDIRNSYELSNLNPEIKTFTTMPVAAASESENIFNSLSLYAQQDAESLKTNAILLNVNWLDTAKADTSKQAKIQKTLDEIERARREFPQLTIATITREYNDEEVKKTGGVIGYVANDLMNTALLTLEEKLKNGELSADADVAIIRQDADMRGMSRHYLSQLEKYMVKNKSVDIFNGNIRDDVHLHSRYPGFGIAANFARALQIANVAANRPWTVGINLVTRASSLAAVGGLGKLGWTGPASDDVEIGQRISAARNGTAAASSYDKSTVEPGEHKVIVHVPGMSVDTAGDRLLQQYLQGRPVGAAWDSDASGATSFTDGPGGYRDRTVGREVTNTIKSESETDAKLYERLEVNFGKELSQSNERAARKVLAIFFAGVPGAYKIMGNIGDRGVEFRFTKAGRKFIKERIAKEANAIGGPGSRYGQRQMRRLYGQQVVGGRAPKVKESPYVEPSS